MVSTGWLGVKAQNSFPTTCRTQRWPYSHKFGVVVAASSRTKACISNFSHVAPAEEPFRGDNVSRTAQGSSSCSEIEYANCPLNTPKITNQTLVTATRWEVQQEEHRWKRFVWGRIISQNVAFVDVGLWRHRIPTTDMHRIPGNLRDVFPS